MKDEGGGWDEVRRCRRVKEELKDEGDSEYGEYDMPDKVSVISQFYIYSDIHIHRHLAYRHRRM